MDTVELTVDDGVALIRLNRPDRLNAVIPALVDDLVDALRSVRSDDSARAVVLSGAGRAFCAGHDLREPTPEGDSRPRLERMQEVTRCLRGLSQPVIAAVHGYAIGAGAEFALGCDLVVAADDAVFQFPEAGLGLSVTGAASRLLPLAVGPLKAKELLLLGQRCTAREAHEFGLVNAVTEHAGLLEQATTWARQLATQPPAGNTLAKRALDAGIDATVETALELEVSHALVTDNLPDAEASAENFRNRQ